MKSIFLVGDSIRQGYDKFVKQAFSGIAEVYYPGENCQFSTYIVRHLYDWKNDIPNCETLDLIHWNAGLWDSLVMPDGQPLLSLEDYAKSIERICCNIAQYFPKAKMIFATSTPVQEELFVGVTRFNKTVERYNAAATEIVLRHGGTVNDLYTLMKNQPLSYHSDRTHFYTKDGTACIAGRVIQQIEKALGLTANPVDYAKFFTEKKDFKGV